MTLEEERNIVAGMLSGKIRLRDVKSRSCDDFADEHMRTAFAIAASWLECGARPSPERLILVARSLGREWDGMDSELAALATGSA